MNKKQTSTGRTVIIVTAIVGVLIAGIVAMTILSSGKVNVKMQLGNGSLEIQKEK